MYPGTFYNYKSFIFILKVLNGTVGINIFLRRRTHEIRSISKTNLPGDSSSINSGHYQGRIRIAKLFFPQRIWSYYPVNDVVRHWFSSGLTFDLD